MPQQQQDQIFGLDIHDDLSLGEIAVPISALTILKTLDTDDNVTWRVIRTDGLTSVEALGMARYASGVIEKHLLSEDDD